MNVVLVHGFLDNARLMRRLAEPLGRAGHTCFAPSLKPSDGRTGLEALSLQLGEYILGTVPPAEPFAVVGFSMGAIVARHYLQRGGDQGRARLFASVGGPHHGTYSAYLYPGRGTRELRFGSAFMRELEEGLPALKRLRVVSYASPYDAMIRPVSTAWVGVGDTVVIPAWLHVGLLSDRRLHADLLRRLEA